MFATLGLIKYSQCLIYEQLHLPTASSTNTTLPSMHARLAGLEAVISPRLQLLLFCCYREAGGTGYLNFIQQQEEEALQTALSKLRQQEADGRKP